MASLKSRQLPGLYFERNFLGGRKIAVYLDRFVSEKMARKVIELLNKETMVGGLYQSSGVIKQRIAAFCCFGDWLKESKVCNSVSDFRDIEPDHLNQFEKYLYQRFDGGAGAYRMASTLISLLQDLSGSNAFQIETLRSLDQGTGIFFVDSNLREPYSPYVAKQLRSASLSVIKQAEERILRNGRSLYDDLSTRDAAHLDIVDKIILGVAEGRIRQREDIDLSYRSTYKNLAFSGKAPSLTEIYSYFFPTIQEILALYIHLSLDTGLPIESVRELYRKCIVNRSDSYATILYIKRRRGIQSLQGMRVRLAGEYSPVRLLDLALRLTQRAREFCDKEDKRFLLIGRAKRSPGINNEFRQLVPKAASCKDFCDQHEILDDEGRRLQTVDLTRLRKTYKKERYLKNPGKAATAGDHSVSMFNQRYASVEALVPIHEQTVENALADALKGVMEPTILQATNNDEAGETDIGKSSVWLADCQDVYNSPFNEADQLGQLCRIPIWGCLACKNAVISTAKLPAILAFLAHITEMRRCIELETWARHYGRAYAMIKFKIIPAFTDGQIQRARELLAVETQSLLFPPELLKSR